MSGEWWLLSGSQKSWCMWEPASSHKMVPLLLWPYPFFQVKPWKPWSPKLNLPPAEMPLWWLTFGTVRERTWPPCFGLFLNLSTVVLAAPITWYQSLVLLWILLTIWPLQCFWQGLFASSCAMYSYLILLPFKCLMLQVHSWFHLEIVTVSIIGYFPHNY